jgi:general stress protein 26
MSNTTITPTSDSATGDRHVRGDDTEQLGRIRRTLAKQSFAVVSTVSDAGYPHAAGVVYCADGLSMYVHTMRSSRKARNVATGGRAGVVVPVRKLPVGPPFNVQFQADAEIVEMDAPEIVDLVGRGVLKRITGHGELDEPDGCFIRLRPRRRMHSYGIGVSTLALARDPLHVGARTVEL